MTAPRRAALAWSPCGDVTATRGDLDPVMPEPRRAALAPEADPS